MEFKDLIYNYRKDNRLSQEEFGNRIGVTKTTVSTWELGKRSPSASIIASISKEFGIPIEELYQSLGIAIGSPSDYVAAHNALEQLNDDRNKLAHGEALLRAEQYREIMSQISILSEKLDRNSESNSFDKKLKAAFNEAPENIKISICTLLGIAYEKHEN